jgi:hypothetical protein
MDTTHMLGRVEDGSTYLSIKFVLKKYKNTKKAPYLPQPMQLHKMLI